MLYDLSISFLLHFVILSFNLASKRLTPMLITKSMQDIIQPSNTHFLFISSLANHVNHNNKSREVLLYLINSPSLVFFVRRYLLLSCLKPFKTLVIRVLNSTYMFQCGD